MTTIASLKISASSEGFPDATAKVNALAAAEGNLIVVKEKDSAATLSQASKLNTLQKSLDTVYRGEQQFAKAEALLAAGVNEGSISIERQNELLGLASAKYLETGVAAETMARGVEVAKDVALGLVTGLGAGLALGGLAELPEKVRQSVEDLTKVANDSKASGLDPELFQAITNKAQQSGVQIDQVSTALDSFYKASGQAEVGTGRLLTQLRKLDPELALQIESDTTQEQRLKDLSDAIAGMTDKAKAAAVAAAAFGPAGIKMINVIGQGSQAIDDLVREGKDIGEIVPEDLVDRADELGKKFDVTSQILKTQFEATLIELGPVLVDTASALDKVAIGVGTIVDSFQSIDQRVLLNPLENELAVTENNIVQIKGHIADVKAQVANMPDSVLGIPNPIKALNQNEINASQTLLGQQYDTASQYQNRIDQLSGMGKPPAAPPPDVATGDRAQQLKDYLSSHSKQLADADADAKAYRKTTDALNLQLKTLGETDKQKEIDDELSKAHVSAMSDEGKHLTDLAGKYYDQEQAIKAANDAAGFFAQTAESAFEGLVTGGESFTNVLGDIGKELANAVIQAELLGSGPLAGILGTAPTTAGQTGGLLGSIAGGIESLFTHHATGGVIRGPGSRTSDSIPAMLSDGEYVVRANAVEKFRPLLDAINYGHISKMAAGGAVRAPGGEAGSEFCGTLAALAA